MYGILAAEEPAPIDRCYEILDRATVIAVVALAIARQQPAQLMMEIVGPEAVQAPAALVRGFHHVRQVAVVLGNQLNPPIRRGSMNPLGQFGEDVLGAAVENRVRSVEA